jgi:hypothetical protein
MVPYPAAFKSLTALKAECVPTPHEALDPRKLIELVSGFVEPTLDNYLNMVVSGSDMYQIFKNTDPWLNFYSLLPTFKVKPDLDAVNKFKRDPDAIWTDYFFNGGNPLSVRKAANLGEIPYV